MYDVSASIVLYNNDPIILTNTIYSFLATDLNVSLFLFDNSETDDLKSLVNDDRIFYHFNKKNIGFGSGHNFAIKYYLDNSKYHLVLNPDIFFSKGTIEGIFTFMNTDSSIGLLMPKIMYPNKEIQYLCINNPTPFILFARRFLTLTFFKPILDKINYSYEMRYESYDSTIYNIPYLSGCFMFFNVSVFKTIGFFDEKIFMYIEDADITRRVLGKFKTVYYPMAEVYHYFEKGSHKKFRLMLYSIKGAFIYFNKWGWFK